MEKIYVKSDVALSRYLEWFEMPKVQSIHNTPSTCVGLKTPFGFELMLLRVIFLQVLLATLSPNQVIQGQNQYINCKSINA